MTRFTWISEEGGTNLDFGHTSVSTHVVERQKRDGVDMSKYGKVMCSLVEDPENTGPCVPKRKMPMRWSWVSGVHLRAGSHFLTRVPSSCSFQSARKVGQHPDKIPTWVLLDPKEGPTPHLEELSALVFAGVSIPSTAIRQRPCTNHEQSQTKAAHERKPVLRT